MTSHRTLTRTLTMLILALAVGLVIILSGPQQAHAAFPGQNGKIVFRATDTSGGGAEIFSINSDGTGRKNLTNDPAEDTEPAVSPDGRKIVFTSMHQPSNDRDTDIFVMNANGTNLKRVTSSSLADSSPSFSPDGKRIVYQRKGESGGSDIFIAPVDGSSNPVQVTTDPAFDEAPVFSPGGTRIAFHSNRGGNSEIFTVRPNGTDLRQITPSKSINFNPNWSPDGKKLVFDHFQNELSKDGEIATINANGTGLKQLTNNEISDGTAAYSPDGTKIVFARGVAGAQTGNDYQLATMNADGTQTRQLKTGVGFNFLPDWGVRPIR